MGWFFGCKLLALMNQSGDIVRKALSNGHTADIKMVEQFVKGMTAKLYASLCAYQLCQQNKPTIRVIELLA